MRLFENFAGMVGVALICVVSGCQSPEIAYLHPTRLTGTPPVEIKLMDASSRTSWARFVFIPSSQVFQHPALNSAVLENALQFEIRSRLESQGYIYTADPSNADLLVTADGHCDYGSSRHAGSLTGAAIYSSGDYQSNPYSDVPVPLERPLDTESRVSYSEDMTIVGITVLAFDARTRKKVWAGISACGAHNFDLRIAGQQILDRLINAFPPKAGGPEASLLSKSGLHLEVYTVDGGNYWPVVVSIEKGSSAEAKGIATGDVLLSLDGIPTKGLSMGAISQRLRDQKNPGRQELTFWRMGRSADLVVTLAQ